MRNLGVVGTRGDGFGPTPDPAERAESALASDRLRVALPADRLRSGWKANSGKLPEPFADAAVLRADLVAGLAEALSAPAQMLARISAGQRRIEAAYSPAAVASQWRAVLAG